jgi:hypothetical protein
VGSSPQTWPRWDNGRALASPGVIWHSTGARGWWWQANSMKIFRPRSTGGQAMASRESRQPPHFSSFDISPWQVSRVRADCETRPPGLAPDRCCRENLFSQPLDLMLLVLALTPLDPSNCQKRSPSSTRRRRSLRSALPSALGIPWPGPPRHWYSKALPPPRTSLGHSITSRLSPCPTPSCL